MGEALFTTNLPELELLHRGKVRDVYKIDNEHLLIVTTDRISAFDQIIKSPIPTKGIILSELSSFWFQRLADIVPNHWISGPQNDLRLSAHSNKLPLEVSKRSMLVKMKKRVDMECIVRGYLTGSAWRDYKRTGYLNGIKLANGLLENSRFEKPLFTPSTKASNGTHDEPITQSQGEKLIGSVNYAKLRELSFALYEAASSYLNQKGLILADTKFEFGFCKQSGFVLIDEIFTPDSSRFWNLDDWQPGKFIDPLDKEFLRNWLIQTGQKDNGGEIELPIEVVNKTLKRYTNLYERVLDRKFNG